MSTHSQLHNRLATYTFLAANAFARRQRYCHCYRHRLHGPSSVTKARSPPTVGDYWMTTTEIVGCDLPLGQGRCDIPCILAAEDLLANDHPHVMIWRADDDVVLCEGEEAVCLGNAEGGGLSQQLGEQRSRYVEDGIRRERRERLVGVLVNRVVWGLGEKNRTHKRRLTGATHDREQGRFVGPAHGNSARTCGVLFGGATATVKFLDYIRRHLFGCSRECLFRERP